MHTEDEASNLWCPKTRVTAGSDGQGHAEWHTNRLSHAEVHEKNFDRCIASKCMAWRWAISPEGVKAAKRQSFREPWAIEALKRGPTGFCGLAGRPD